MSTSAFPPAGDGERDHPTVPQRGDEKDRRHRSDRVGKGRLKRPCGRCRRDERIRALNFILKDAALTCARYGHYIEPAKPHK